MLLSLGVLLLTQGGDISDPRRSYAAGDKEAYLLLPPLTVCDSDVREMVWTGDGGSLIVRRIVTSATPADYSAASSGKPTSSGDVDRLRLRIELLVWSARSHKSRVVVSADAQNLHIAQIEPLPGTDRVVFGADERIVESDGTVKNVSSYSVLAADTGTVTRLVGFDATQTYVGAGLSPKRPIGYLSAIDAATKSRSVRFFGPEGRLGNAIALPPKSQLVFNEAGLPMLSLGYDKQGKKVTFHFQRVNVAAGILGDRYDGTIDDEYDPSSVTPTIQAVPVTGTADGSRAPSILLKISGGKPNEAGVLSTDGMDAQLSPKGDAVAYVSQGSAVVRPLARVSRQAYDAAMTAARKAIAMSKAKQVALGLIMFAADMDDVLPSQGDYNKIDPYLKDSSLRDSFSYTFGGGDISKIDKPADTEIGYVSGPGGRAVAYADGHVKWVPDGS